MHAGVGTAGAIHLDRTAEHGLERTPHLTGHSTLARLLGISGEVGTAVPELDHYGPRKRGFPRERGLICQDDCRLFRHANLLLR